MECCNTCIHAQWYEHNEGGYCDVKLPKYVSKTVHDHETGVNRNESNYLTKDRPWFNCFYWSQKGGV